MKRFLACLLFAGHAHAVDLSDLWSVPSEQGWGVNVIQQFDVLFITMFAYGADGKPVWYFGSNLSVKTGSSYTGPWYQATGPYHGGAFNPAALSVREVGTAKFSPRDADAEFTYTVDGVTITKVLKRQVWRKINFTAEYLGGWSVDYIPVPNTAGCPKPGMVEEPVTFNITQYSNDTFMLELRHPAGTCTFQGTYTQAGREGQVNGSFDCSDGLRGRYTADGMNGYTNEALKFGLYAVTANSSCIIRGFVGAVGKRYGVR